MIDPSMMAGGRMGPPPYMQMYPGGPGNAASAMAAAMAQFNNLYKTQLCKHFC